MHSPVEDHDLVPSLPDNLKSQTHSSVSEFDGRPSVQVKPSPVNTMVTASAGVQTDLSQVVHFSYRSICHSSEPQSSTVYISSPRPKCLGHRCSGHKLVGSHCLCLPPHSSPSQGDPKDQAIQCLVIVIAPGCPGMPWFWDLVQLSTEFPLQYQCQQLFLNSPIIIGFSVEVAERILAPQRSSTRTIYKSKWALFEKWCRENSVNFSIPYVKQVSNFFMYLYQDLNRCPLTIGGYRMAIVDTLGSAGHHISKSSDLNRLLSSFHRDRPKSSRNIPKWNLSVVLNELTKAPFEPMKDTDLKHLTLKIAFLLALAPGKCHSEIHAWVANKVSNLGQWEKVALFPLSDFKAKNQLAREGSQSVSPVTIPALTTR